MNSRDIHWLCLMIGNSRLHWAWFAGEKLQKNGDSPKNLMETTPQSFIRANVSPHLLNLASCPLYVASVVPEQTSFWTTYPKTHVISLDQVPLLGLYSTIGIDRVLALWGAGKIYGFPMLVIDGGTALTLTGANAQKQLVGGAILTGLQLQMQSLAQKTAALSPKNLPDQLPSRWALNTDEAIASGIVYTMVASLTHYLQDWWRQFPNSAVILTGGDAQRLWSYLHATFPAIADQVKVDPHLIFWGIREVRRLGNRDLL